jgi:hypothetical protein
LFRQQQHRVDQVPDENRGMTLSPFSTTDIQLISRTRTGAPLSYGLQKTQQGIARHCLSGGRNGPKVSVIPRWDEVLYWNARNVSFKVALLLLHRGGFINPCRPSRRYMVPRTQFERE